MDLTEYRYEHRDLFENEKKTLMTAFEEWSRRYLDNLDIVDFNKVNIETVTQDYNSDPLEFINDVMRLFNESTEDTEAIVIDKDRLKEMVKKVITRLLYSISRAEVKVKPRKTESEKGSVFEIFPDWLVWEKCSSGGVYVTQGNKFDLIFDDGNLTYIIAGHSDLLLRSYGSIKDPDLSKLIKDCVLTGELNTETFSKLNKDTKRSLLENQRKIVTQLENAYSEEVARLVEWLQALTEFRRLSSEWNPMNETKEILYKASQNLRQKLFPHRKKSIRESDEILASRLLELDKTKADLHRKIVSFRYFTEAGIDRDRVTAELEISMRAKKRDSIPIRNGVIGTWSEDYFSIHIENGSSFSIILGSGETMTVSSDGIYKAAPKPAYSSFISSERSRDDDIDLAEKIIELVSRRFPGLRGYNNLKILGSFHESFTGNEVVFNGSEISKVSKETGLSPDVIAQTICDIVKGELDSLR